MRLIAPDIDSCPAVIYHAQSVLNPGFESTKPECNPSTVWRPTLQFRSDRDPPRQGRYFDHFAVPAGETGVQGDRAAGHRVPQSKPTRARKPRVETSLPCAERIRLFEMFRKSSMLNRMCVSSLRGRWHCICPCVLDIRNQLQPHYENAQAMKQRGSGVKLFTGGADSLSSVDHTHMR
jgi:hypothetical protein